MPGRITLFASVLVLTACAAVEPFPVYKPLGLAAQGYSAAAFSPSGQLAAVATSETVWLINSDSMTTRAIFSGYNRSGTNNTLVFIDENNLASTATIESADGEGHQAALVIWNVQDLTSDPNVFALPELGSYSISVARSESTGALAVGGENGVVVMLEPNSQDSYDTRQFPGLTGPVLDVLFSRDGSLLAAGGVHPEVPIWDTGSLQEVGSLPVSGTVYDLDLIPSERALLIAGDELKIWKFMTHEELRSADNPSMAGDYIYLGAMTALEAMAAAMGGYSFSTRNWGHPHEPDYGFCTRITEVSPTGDFFVDKHSGRAWEKLRIIEIPSGKVLQKLRPASETCGAAFSPDGTKLLIVSVSSVRLYDTSSWKWEKVRFE